MIGIIIRNNLTGRYLEDYKTGDYLIFPTVFSAMRYIKKQNLNTGCFEFRKVVSNEINEL